MNQPWIYMCSPSQSHLPPHPIPLGLPSAPALSTCLMHFPGYNKGVTKWSATWIFNPFQFLPNAGDSFIVFSSVGSFHLFQCFLRHGGVVLRETARSTCQIVLQREHDSTKVMQPAGGRAMPVTQAPFFQANPPSSRPPAVLILSGPELWGGLEIVALLEVHFCSEEF